MTDVDGNKCHRSANAYPKRLVDDGTVALNLDFGACSGALINDLAVTYDPNRPPYTDGTAQLDRLGSSTKLVTLGIGGNDLGFSDVLTDCITATVLDAMNPFAEKSCQEAYDARLQTSYDTLADGDRLGAIYKEVRRRAPLARVVVVGYPRFYVEGGARNDRSDNHCGGMRIADQRWINSQIRRLNTLIGNTARGLGLQYVNDYDVPDGHELCGQQAPAFLNGVDLLNKVESYHPTSFGQGLIAARVAGALNSPDPGAFYNVLPGQTISTPSNPPGGH